MDVIGIGGPEFLILLLLGAVVLGPRRVVGLARDIGKSLRQIQNITRNITKEINREFDLLDLQDRQENKRVSKAQGTDSQPHENGHAEAQLPEAYKRFREDFPEEGGFESAPGTGSEEVSANQ